jgi:SH3 domain-containing YSC84-like protein 1
MTKCRLLLLVSVAWLLDSGGTLRAQDREIAILEKASTALNEVEAMPFDSLPYHRFMMAQLRKAQGVAIFPDMFKAAVGIGGRKGRGVLLIREADGSWGPPIFLKLSGVSAGIQLGMDRTDLVLTCRTPSNSEHLKKGKLTLGLDNTLAIGSIGVEHILSADAVLKTCIFSPASPSRGLFAGWSVEGNRLRIDTAATAAYEQYEQNSLRNSGPMGAGTPSPSLRLQMRLAELTAAPPATHVIAPSR